MLLLGFILNQAAHAEGGCPPGMIPYSGTDIRSCAPIPGNGQPSEEPPQSTYHWKSRWVAIASDEFAASVGVAANASSAKEAKKKAVLDCEAKGGKDCKIQVSLANGCAVMTMGDNSYNSNFGSTVEEATKKSMDICNMNDKNCQVTYSACSRPALVQ